jgi:hypothetical protein
VVLDVDPGHGGRDSIAALAAHGPLPDTLGVQTGGGGRHLYFAHPGHRVPNSAGRLGPGLDVRGDGGYVLVPPSRHLAGDRYRWVGAEIQPLPAWLRDLMLLSPTTNSVAEGTVRRTDARAWAAAALAREAACVRHALVGCRNHTLNRAAFVLGQLVAGGHLDDGQVIAALTVAAIEAGLTATETRVTIASGLRAGVKFPRYPSA